MTTCGSLHNIFEKALPQNPSILDSFSSFEDSPYTQILGDNDIIHFKENTNESFCSSPLPLSSASSGEIILPSGIEEIFHKENKDSPDRNSGHKKQYIHSDSFSSQNSETLSLCIESIGFESFDDIEESRSEYCFDFQFNEDSNNNRISRSSSSSSSRRCYSKESKRSRTTGKKTFPPPISCIGKTGKPWVYFESYRKDGRFILRETRIPTQEFLHACREDGRLRMKLIQSDDEFFDEDDDDDDIILDDDDDILDVDEE